MIDLSQSGFTFEGPLTTDPVSQIAAKAPKGDAAELVARLMAILPDLPDDIELDAPLLALGLTKESLTGWHRTRAMDALLGMNPTFQAYRAENGLRYRRLPPLLPCPGYEDRSCGKPTRGGKRCVACSEIENEDLWNTL